MIYSIPAKIEKILQPYKGPYKKGVEPDTLHGKIMCGYQGWFTTPSDGANLGWKHYENNGVFRPGTCSIDIWPDLREMDKDELFPTLFKHKNGKTAYVFSSHNKKTVLRHFKWMKDYGIDGAFVQRFAVEIKDMKSDNFYHATKVLKDCREGANLYGRTFVVMYDLSGLRKSGTSCIINDWKLLKDKMKITECKAYQHHNGKPVVGVWGVGFKRRSYTLKECKKLIQFFKNDRKYGGNRVMLGVPTGWRTLSRDTMTSKELLKVIGQADIISPWTPGRMKSMPDVKSHSKIYWEPDVKICKKAKRDYMPVVYPGFSWKNMRPQSTFNAIPRLKGQFLWKQYYELLKLKVKMIYVAMFDEIDEATAIFKCSNDPPVGKSRFLTYEGLPSDHYLWLTGQAKNILQKKRKLTKTPPKR